MRSSTTTSRKYLIALVAHSITPCGLALLDVLREYERRELESCRVIDGLKNPVDLATEAMESGFELILFGCSFGNKTMSRVESQIFNPIGLEEVGSEGRLVEIIYEGYAGFLGSPDVVSLAKALRLLYSKPFRVILLHCHEIMECKTLSLSTLKELCFTE